MKKQQECTSMKKYNPIFNPPQSRRVFLCPKLRKEHEMKQEKLYVIEEKGAVKIYAQICLQAPAE